MDNKNTWMVFWTGVLTIIVLVWDNLCKITVCLAKAFYEIVRFPASAIVLILLILLSFFIGKNFPYESRVGEPNKAGTSEVGQVDKVKGEPKTEKTKTNQLEAEEKAKAEKAKAADLEAKAKAKAEKAKADELEARAKAEIEARAKIKAKAEAYKAAPIRDTIIVDKNTVYFYNKDPEREFFLEEYVDGGKGQSPVLKKTSKDMPCKPFDRINAKNNGKYMMLKLVSKGYESPMMTFTKDETPAAVLFENGEATIYKDLSVLPVDIVYPN